MLASLFLIGTLFAAPQMSIQAASQTIVEDSADGRARAVNRMLGGIISYARWPGKPANMPRSMCIVGAPQMTNRIAPGGPTVTVRRMTVAGITDDGGCDIIFMGRMPAADRQRLIGWVRSRPVLTVTDDDATCVHGAMFCLDGRRTSLSFSVNLDSIGRGPLRIDPRVLKIGGSE